MDVLDEEGEELGDVPVIKGHDGEGRAAGATPHWRRQGGPRSRCPWPQLVAPRHHRSHLGPVLHGLEQEICNNDTINIDICNNDIGLTFNRHTWINL